MKTHPRTLAGATVLALALTGCGSADPAATTGTSTGISTTVVSTATSAPSAVATTASDTGSSAAPSAHNDADVSFVLMMIEHHRGAVAMAQLAPDRADDPQVVELAAAIEAAQAPEIEQMTGLLQAWNAAMMPGGNPSHGMDMGDDSGMDMGTDGTATSGPAMPGMMSADQMAELSAASGVAFDRMFLEMMIAHHQGAVEMSATEIAEGQNADAVALARSITESQTAEIARMQELLQGK